MVGHSPRITPTRDAENVRGVHDSASTCTTCTPAIHRMVGHSPGVTPTRDAENVGFAMIGGGGEEGGRKEVHVSKRENEDPT